MRKVAVTGDYARIARAAVDWSVLGPEVELRFFHDPFADEDAAARQLQGFDVICHTRERLPMPASLLARLPDLRLLVVTGKAHRTLDLQSAKAQGILVSHASHGDLLNPSTPEHTWALILAAARQVVQADHDCRQGRWSPPVGMELAGKILGIVGLGALGTRVALMAQAFGMHVFAWSPNLTPERAHRANADAVGKRELFERADVVSLHLVLDASTRGIVGAADIARMQRHAILVNTARGGLVDQPALVRALQERRIGGAALDVFATEPLPRQDPLTRLDNVVLSPHAGYSTRETYGRFYAATLRMLQAYAGGFPLHLL